MVSFPFSALVGQDDLRLALLLNAVSPTVGGVLVRGEKGTAKSTAVRALAGLLPPVAVVPGCRFSCDPVAPVAHCPDGPHLTGPAAGHGAGGVGVSRPARLVELPVGASEDRVTGALDLDRALAEGVSALRPGLLAAAHRGVLYVDEVNLLADHLVDLLLDASALGVAQVERDGVSVSHPARFWLVGTMNPEEGELRPQLLDRFGLTVQVAASRDPRVRAQVVRRRLTFEADPVGFAALWAGAEAELAGRIARAQARLGRVELPDAALDAVAAVCAACDVDGMRADVVLAKTAMARAAWEGRAEVSPDDIRVAARFVLPHRRRRGPFDAPGGDGRALDDTVEEVLAERVRPGDGPDGDGSDDSPGGGSPGGGRRWRDDTGGAGGSGVDVPAGGTGDLTGASAGAGGGSADLTGPAAGGSEGVGPVGGGGPAAEAGGPAGMARAAQTAQRHHVDGGAAGGGGPAPAAGVPGMPFRPRLLSVAGLGAGAAGRRSAARTSRGAVARTGADAPGLHLPATLLAAAPHQHGRGRTGPALILRPADRRGAHRRGREGNLVLFVVDASGSMAARSRLRRVSTAVLSLLVDAYQRRDRIGMITFRGVGAQVVLAPTSSVEVGAARLVGLRTGGRTPIAAGLECAGVVLRAEARRDPDRRPLLVLVTDGRATAGGDPGAAARGLLRAAGGVAGQGGGARGGAGAAGRVRRGGLASVVVDCETGPVRLGLAGRLAVALGADLVDLDALPRAGGAAGWVA
ncbi:VWA domain-containing protein [Parafrankia discariae]|uniref:VWA domain-containing protein n=1 Tax=Parafrankia discariae TaxID=365528 RepID=UPI0004760FBF|nr:VWA domain-containing protein [Parafrankia discariae]